MKATPTLYKLDDKFLPFIEFTKIITSLDFFVEACAELDSVFLLMKKRKNEENFNATRKH